MSKAVIALLLMISAAVAKSGDEGTYYKYGQLGVKKKVISQSNIEMTFDPMQEQFHWCPGIKVQETKKGTVVTFVRCKTSKTCPIDGKAKIGKKMIRSVTIAIRGKDVFVRDGATRYKRIYQFEKKKKKQTALHIVENRFVAASDREQRSARPLVYSQQITNEFARDDSLPSPPRHD